MLNCTPEELQLLPPLMDTMLNERPEIYSSRRSLHFRGYFFNHKSKTWIKKRLKQLKIGVYFDMPLSECPLHINNNDPIIAAIARWRLKIGR